MNCKHYKGEGYTYKVGKEDLDLCEQCNLNLAMEFMKQMAVEIYGSCPAHNKLQDVIINKIEKKFKYPHKYIGEKFRKEEK